LRQLAVIALDLLNVVEPDPDLEPDADAEDTATERHGFGFVASGPDDEEDDAPREDDDPREENGDLEPSLGWTIGGKIASGNDNHDLDCDDDPAERGEPAHG
jgi:hypothetical protein